MMMRTKKLLIFLVVLFVHSATVAQHYVGAMVDGTMAWQFDKNERAEITTPQLGGGASVGGLYQFQYNQKSCFRKHRLLSYQSDNFLT